MAEASLGLGPDRSGSVLLMTGDRVSVLGSYQMTVRPAKTQILCPGAEIRPGAVNAHTHIYSGLAPLGMPAPKKKPKNFLQILERVWWRMDRALDRSSLEAAARLYVAEALLAGTTTLIDHHESPEFIEGSLDVLADVCDELGMRAVLCYGATERNGGREEAKRGLAECRRFLESNRRLQVRGMIGLHASFTVSDETAREAGDLARELNVPVHVHVAEDRSDVEDARKRGYRDPLDRLLRLDALPRGSFLAHGIHLDPEQVRRAADEGLWFVQNPRSNRGNRVGYPNAFHGCERIALGTDGYPAGMAQEAKALFEEAALNGEDEDMVRSRLEVGYDLVSERYGLPFVPLRSGAAADAVAVEGDEVRHVVVGGRLVVQDGKLLTGDVDEIRAGAADEAPRLWKRMAAL